MRRAKTRYELAVGVLLLLATTAASLSIPLLVANRSSVARSHIVTTASTVISMFGE